MQMPFFRGRMPGRLAAATDVGSLLRRVLPGGTLTQGLQEILDRVARPAASGSDAGPFLSLNYAGRVGSRPYKLYVPGGYRGEPLPLLIMLHGCQQSPDDFAAGTRMNAVAEEHACLVAYPGQTNSANASRCWNWFNGGEQGRDRGEPAVIAGIARAVMDEYAVDRRRVYAAGLSAGGAEAAILGSAYPDLFAAIGVHSGLACGAARDVSSAFTAMHSGAPGAGRHAVPAIVFHGDRDATVHPRNADAVIAQAMPAFGLDRTVVEGKVEGGRAYTVTRYADAAGRVVLEQWMVRGAGHAWSGGSADGSYTDPLGPDASAEMLRFFLAHPHQRR